ncbi:MAG: hypothetical protein V4621_05100 [Pseudomonadota bacterium]
MHNWQKLDKEQTEAMINAVRSSSEALLFSPSASEGTIASLPFYNTFSLYRLTNYTSLPIFTMEFLSDGETYVYLDGSDDSLLKTNTKDGLRLTPRNIMAYLDFYFANTVRDEGEIHTYSGTTESGGLALSVPSIAFDPQTSAYTVACPLYVDGVIMHATVHISPEGIVTLHEMRPYLTEAASSFNTTSRPYGQ